MGRASTSLVMYVFLTSVLLIFLVVAGESRPDAYLSISILVYFIFTVIDTSIRSRAKMLFMDVVLLAVFITIVLFRVLIVLGIV